MDDPSALARFMQSVEAACVDGCVIKCTIDNIGIDICGHRGGTFATVRFTWRELDTSFVRLYDGLQAVQRTLDHG